MYITEVKRIDADKVIDGLHWLELTTDDEEKKAFSNGVPPKELALYMVKNARMPEPWE